MRPELSTCSLLKFQKRSPLISRVAVFLRVPPESARSFARSRALFPWCYYYFRSCQPCFFGFLEEKRRPFSRWMRPLKKIPALFPTVGQKQRSREERYSPRAMIPKDLSGEFKAFSARNPTSLSLDVSVGNYWRLSHWSWWGWIVSKDHFRGRRDNIGEVCSVGREMERVVLEWSVF